MRSPRRRTAWRRRGRPLGELARLTNATIDGNGWLRRGAGQRERARRILTICAAPTRGSTASPCCARCSGKARSPARTALVSSFGAESAVLLDMVATIDPATPVIFLDTGKLFPETHAYREELVDLLRLARRARGRPAPPRRWRATTRAASCGAASPTCAATSARPSRCRRRSRASRAGSPGASASRPGCAASCRRSRRSGRAGGSSSTRWRCGPPTTSSSTGCCATCPSIRWSTRATARSAASPARAR